MNVKKAKRDFERVGATLEQTMQQLVEAPGQAACWAGTLQTAVVALEGMKAQYAASGLSPTFAATLNQLKSRVDRVHLLLESAAALYCGCVAVRTTQPVGYTPEGTLAELTSSGRMQFEA